MSSIPFGHEIALSCRDTVNIENLRVSVIFCRAGLFAYIYVNEGNCVKGNAPLAASGRVPMTLHTDSSRESIEQEDESVETTSVQGINSLSSR